MTGNSLRRVCALILGLCLASGTAYGQHQVFYVDDDSPGNFAPDVLGLSWDKAFNELQDAIQAAFDWVVQGSSYTCEIHVAGAVGGVGGVYIPPESTKRRASDPRTRAFRMVHRTSMLGGYRGCDSAVCGEPGSGEDDDPDRRNVATFETILSGDIDRDDDEPGGTIENNAYHVFYHGDVWVTDEAILDGFTIEKGYASGPAGENDDRGGGMYNYLDWPVVRNCIFQDNVATGEGGGAVYNVARPARVARVGL